MTMSHSNIFFVGPPGTGKTFSCLEQVEFELAEGAHPRDIAYIAFTKIAAREASKRINDNFQNRYDVDQFENFRTLHSLCLRNLPDMSNNIMSKGDYEDFGQTVPINFETKISWEVKEDERGILKVDNPYLTQIQLAKNKMISLEEQYQGLKTSQKDDISYTKLEELSSHLDKYKRQKNLFDFDDMLLEFSKLEDNLIPHFQLFIIDEAQDCSKLQWACINKLIDRAGRTVVAGDDDQAIYVWAGADVNSFREINDRDDFNTKILKQSRRVPRLMHALAERVIVNDKQRIPKEYLPKQDEEGTIDILHEYRQMVPWLNKAARKEMEVLILCTVHKHLAEIGKLLNHAEIKYSYGREGSATSVIEAIKDYKLLQEGKTLTGKRVKKVYAQLQTGTSVARGYKSGKKSPDDLEEYSLQDLIENYGLLNPHPDWQEEFSKISPTDKIYYTELEDLGKDLETKPAVRLSTINSIKGAEADIVFLLDDLSGNEKTIEEWNEAHRKMYVGITRAKKHLFLVEARSKTYRNLWYGLINKWKELQYDEEERFSLRQSSRG